jgi:glyoxylase I family protein
MREHVALTVPDLAEAIAFFVDVLGCEHLYDMGPFSDPEGTWMTDNLDVHPRAEIPRSRCCACFNGANFEVFEYSPPIRSSAGRR